ncbi:GumC family protein [Microvirga sp. TS319]|uniref:GumC family protein n=1 Tax=Microvirga sp. TS319 TaxID=3241165 RepID=UPI00351AAA6E
MLDRVKWPIESDYEAVPAGWDKPQPQFGARELLTVLKRQWMIIASCLVLCLLLSICALVLWPVRYLATAQVMIDPARIEASPNTSGPDRQLDALTIESQVEVSRSGNVLREVVKRLNLVDDPEFGASQEESGSALRSLRKLKEQLLGFVNPGAQGQANGDAVQDEVQAASEKLQRALTVRRVGATNILGIDVLSRDRLKASEIANTIADEYLADQARARTEAIDKASKWLDERLVALRAEAQNAEDALQDFKAKNRSGQSSATLLDLEAQAQSYRRLYEAFLDRHITVEQQMSSPTQSARVITRATPPQNKSEPKSILILGAGIALGGVLGLIAGLIRERLFRRLRSADDVLSALELPCLGIIPDVGKLEPLSLYRADGQQLSEKAASSQVKMQSGLAHLTLAVLAETKPLDRRVLTVTSLKKGEGVTSIATALAYNLSRLGKKVSLIGAPLSGSDSAHSPTGTTEAMPAAAGAVNRTDDAKTCRSQPGLVVTTAKMDPDAPDLEKLINTARNAFDYVIIDAPPLENGLDVLPSLSSSDGVLILLNSAEARKSQVMNTLASWSYMNGKILGIILNRAPRNS